MAAIIQRDGGYQARVRRKGYPQQSKAFPSREEAERWADEVEAAMRSGTFQEQKQPEIRTVRELLQKYLDEESPKKESGDSDEARIRSLQDELGDYGVDTLTSQRVSLYKRERLKERAEQTVIHELNLLHRAYVLGVEEWGVKLPGPIPRTSRPTPPPGRSFRIPPKLMGQIIQNTGSALLGAIAEFAVETAMRRGEIMSLRWEHVNLRRMSVYLPRTKNGDPRTVPLSWEARRILRTLPGEREGLVFKIKPGSVSQAFDRAAKRVGLEHLNFHDLRHEAISRLFERGLSQIEVARISGHKTLSQLNRYTHLDVSHLGKRVRGM